jgi:hypothetical protein
MTAEQREQVKTEVWETVRAMNHAWAVEGDVDKLRDYFHQKMVAITPAARTRLEGRDACVADWQRYVEATKIHNFEALFPRIQLYGDKMFAVVTYFYDMSIELEGQDYQLGGRDMMVLVNEEDRWWVVADQFTPSPETGK